MRKYYIPGMEHTDVSVTTFLMMVGTIALGDVICVRVSSPVVAGGKHSNAGNPTSGVCVD